MKRKLLFTAALALMLVVTGVGQTPASKDYSQQSPFSASKRAKAAHLQQKGVVEARTGDAGMSLLPQMKSKMVFSGWRLDSLLTLTYDYSSSAWVGSFKAIHEYDTAFRSTRYTDYLYDDMLGQWVPEGREVYAFTPQGNISTQTNSYWDAMMNQFVNSVRDEYTYAPTGELTLRISSDWDYQSWQWAPYSRMEYAYDSLSRISEVIFYYWDEFTFVWTKGMREQYSYNAAGQLTTLTFDYWIDFQQLWFPGSMTEYTYHASGLLASEISLYWDFSTNMFIPDNKTEYSYNATGYNTEVISYWYDETLPGWLKQWKEEKTWDSNGNLTVWTGLYWDDMTMQWAPDNRQTHIYDNAWPNAMLAIPYQYLIEAGDFFNHMLTEIKGEYYNGMTWEDDQKAYLYWSPHNLIGIEEVAAPVFAIHPNPAGSYLNIRAAGYEGDVLFELFDMTGRRVAEQQTTSTGRVSLGNLNNGVYVARISSATGVMHQGKVVVKH
jgi:hypothetical protein